MCSLGNGLGDIVRRIVLYISCFIEGLRVVSGMWIYGLFDRIV